jgi:glycosyltransferase involved in cell wall biosynthesis
MSKKLLTIAIPTYNGGNALIQAVESCKYVDIRESDFEVLVVDNCSTDNSIEILEKDYADFKPLRIVRNTVNVGRIPNWNKCITHAEGKYMLYLFANDLISHDNNVKETLAFFDKFPESAVCSVPWIISDFKMENMKSSFQYFIRTPGIGQYEAEFHVKKVVESGRLPFVCLQSNFLRVSDIRDLDIKFDDRYSITSDGIFLSKLAVLKKRVCFFDKHSIIWRQDAPNRLHSNIKYHAHLNQFFITFSIIEANLNDLQINITKSYVNYNPFKYILLYILVTKNKDFRDFKKIISENINILKSKSINKSYFFYYSFSKLLIFFSDNIKRRVINKNTN